MDVDLPEAHAQALDRTERYVAAGSASPVTARGSSPSPSKMSRSGGPRSSAARVWQEMGTPVALAARAPAQLVVDAAGLMAFGAENVQAAAVDNATMTLFRR